MKRFATAVWKGTGADGGGTLTGPSGVLDETPYSSKMRFENEDGQAGTNPEELIAAAHAGCYSMALSYDLARKGFEADHLTTKAVIAFEKQETGFAITSITLNLKGKVAGIDKDTFEELAQGAKKNCPVSKALSAVPIDLKIQFEEE